MKILFCWIAACLCIWLCWSTLLQYEWECCITGYVTQDPYRYEWIFYVIPVLKEDCGNTKSLLSFWSQSSISASPGGAPCWTIPSVNPDGGPKKVIGWNLRFNSKWVNDQVKGDQTQPKTATRCKTPWPTAWMQYQMDVAMEENIHHQE